MPSPKSICIISCALLILCVALIWNQGSGDAAPRHVDALSGANGSAARTTQSAAAPSLIHAVPYDGMTASRVAARSGTGIRGQVESSRFANHLGKRGVRPGACVIRADAVTQSKTTTTFEVGLGGETRADDQGYFELPLAEGDWRIVVKHLPGQSTEPFLVEVWYTRVTIGPHDSAFHNLGLIRLPELAVRGTVRRPDGSIIVIPMSSSDGISVTFSDKRLDATQGIAGCEFSVNADPEGRFALALARSDEGWVKGTLRAEFRRARVEQRDVLMGDICFLALDIDAIPSRAEPPIRILVDGDEGTLVVWHDETERPISVEVAGLPKSSDGHRVFTMRVAADSVVSYELRRRDRQGGWRVTPGSFKAKADGIPHHVEGPELQGREVTGYIGKGVVRRLVARSRGRHVVVDEVHAGLDGRFRLMAVPAAMCTLVTPRGTLEIPASEALTTDVGVVGAQSGEVR